MPHFSISQNAKLTATELEFVCCASRTLVSHKNIFGNVTIDLIHQSIILRFQILETGELNSRVLENHVKGYGLKLSALTKSCGVNGVRKTSLTECPDKAAFFICLLSNFHKAIHHAQ